MVAESLRNIYLVLGTSTMCTRYSKNVLSAQRVTPQAMMRRKTGARGGGGGREYS